MAVTTPEALAAAFSGALNDGDADALGALFTKDALFVNIAGMRMPGRDGIIDGHRWALAGPLKGSTVTVEDLAVIPVRDDLAILHATSVRTPGPTPRRAACHPAAPCWSSPSSALTADGSRPRLPTPR